MLMLKRVGVRVRNIHKGWVILAFIVLTVLACLGFGRFSFGAIIPFMKDGLDFDYRQTGLIASSVFFGYLIGVTVIGFFVIRYGAKRVIIASLCIIALGMVLSGNANGFWLAYIGCLLTGIGTGGAYIPALGLVSQWFAPSKKGMAMGIAMSGAGIGMVFSGFIVPLLVSLSQESGWRFSWYILAVLVIAIAILNIFTLKNKPEEVGLTPIGQSFTDEEISNKPKEMVKEDKWGVYKNKLMWSIGIIYFFWGFSYIIFSTFLVDYLMKDLGYEKELAGTFFAIVGITSIISGFIWGSVSDRLGRMFALSIVYLTQFLVLVGLSFSKSPGIVAVEIIIYGLTLWGVPAIMNASVSDFIEMKYVPVAMGFITIFFSIGQFISPLATGYIIDITEKYFIAFLLSAILCLLGGLGCIALHITHKKKNQLSQMNSIRS
jgi:sugar phosphate permease